MLYFIATPIGNLKDITIRAIETLNSVDVIACEDTRNSLKLLNYYNIHKKLIAYHKFNEQNSSEGIIKLLKEGKNIAIISDSGMPVISDPGETIVKKLIEQKIPFTIIPGANAGLCALILSGMNAARFSFIGFLPEVKKERIALLEEIKEYKSTLIFYVAPHDVESTIKTLYVYLGERKAVLVNEITKMYEKTISLNLGDQLNFEPKGEYVLIVEGSNLKKRNELNNLTIEEHLKHYYSLGESKNNAIKKVAKERGLSKNEVYQVALLISK